MNEFIHNLVYRIDGKRVHPLSHIFFFITFVFGFCFLFMGDTTTISSLILYTESAKDFGAWALSLWGVCAMLITVLNTLAIGLHSKFVTGTAMLGFGLWAYALVVYLAGGFWFHVLVVAVPNIWFWAWYYIQVTFLKRKYEKRL